MFRSLKHLVLGNGRWSNASRWRGAGRGFDRSGRVAALSGWGASGVTVRKRAFRSKLVADERGPDGPEHVSLVRRRA